MNDSTAIRLRHFRWMLLSRISEQRLSSLFRQGRLAGNAFLGTGQEAVSAALGMALRPGDVFAPLIRDLAGRLAFGEALVESARVCLGRATSKMRGRDGNVHRGDISQGLWPMVSHLGCMLAPCAGAMLARRLSGRETPGDLAVAATCIGDGGMATGAISEALNLIAVEHLPVVLVVVDNQYAYSTPRRQGAAIQDFAERAAGFGVRAHRCDGTDADDSLKAVFSAVSAARKGEGPQMVSARLLRLCGHGEHDDAAYIDPALRSQYGDCLDLAERRLRDEGLLDEAKAEALRREVRAEVDAAFATALAEPEARLADEDWRVHADPVLAHAGGVR